MDFKLNIDENCQEEIIANVHSYSPLIDEIKHLVLQSSNQIKGYIDKDIVLLGLNNIECFIVENEKTYALYGDKKKYLIKSRLYELESYLPKNFERISKGAIANWNKIIKFKVLFYGAVNAIFASGHEEGISRRCFSILKRRYKL